MSDQSPPLPALLPCPFCGNQPHESDDNSYGDYQYQISCPDEHCLTSYCLAPTEAEAIARWNSRAPVGSKFSISIDDVYTPGKPGKTLVTATGPAVVDWAAPAAKMFKAVLNFLADHAAPQTVIPNDRH